MLAHSLQRRPESVLVLVYSTGGEALLLQRRAPFLFWQSVTGTLEPDENHFAAAKRELYEETGLTKDGELYFSGNRRVFEIDARWRHRYPPTLTHNTEYEYRYRIHAPRAVRIDESEHGGYCWAPLNYSIDQVWSWTNREALQALRAEL